MISFRFHLVSIVAVFLALGLGVLTGTTVLNRGIVSQLERQTDQLVETSTRLRDELGELRSEAETWTRFGTEVVQHVVDGRLSGREALIVTQEGTATAAIDRVRRGLEAAGAELTAVLSVHRRMDLAAPADADALAELLAIAETEPEALRAEAAGRLAERLAQGPPDLTSEAPGASPDPLPGLLAAGFLLNRGPGLGEQGLAEVGGPGQVVVAVAGGPARADLPPAGFLVPLVESLAGRGRPVAAAESRDSADPFVTLLRGGAVAGLIVTQDNVDETPGEIGLVLALEGLLEERRAGHFGVKDGADRLIPAP